MPSTIGHALAGLTTAWTADLVPGNRGWRIPPARASWYRKAGNGVTIICAVLAAIPDADLLLHAHRTYSHSIGAVAFVGLFAAAMAAYTDRPVARITLMCAAAYGSHLLLDWLSADTSAPYGLQALWPFNKDWYISGLNLFPRTERRMFLSAATVRTDLVAIATELAIMLPIAIVVWSVRVKALARLAAEEPRGDHAPQ